MRIVAGALAALGMLAGARPAISQSPSPHRIRTDIRFLSSDLLEGRAPGTRGDVLAAEYVRAQFSQLGLRVSFQNVPLLGIETQPTSRFGPLAWLTDYAGIAANQQEENSFQFAEIVFAGYGITAPDLQRDDYGDTVVRGKVVVLLAGDPPGSVRTDYGAAEYKFDEAARHGATAAVIIHTPESAGFGWDTVRRWWGGEQVQGRRDPRQPALQLAGWVTQEAAARWLDIPHASLVAEAGQPGFRARSLEKRMAARILSKVRTLTTRNVIAVVPGGDEDLAEEAVLFTAHLDHLGSAARGAADTIYNGAVDNATGVAVMLEVARLWMEIDPRPRRTAVFLATAAEEAGARGAEAYRDSPVVPLAATKLALDFHAYLPLGRTRDFLLDGVDRSPLGPVLRQTAERFGVQLKPAIAPAVTDASILARAGAPAFTLQPGSDYSAEPVRKAGFVAEYFATQFHQPGDEFHEDWDLSGMEQAARLGFELGLAVANLPVLPK